MAQKVSSLRSVSAACIAKTNVQRPVDQVDKGRDVGIGFGAQMSFVPLIRTL